LIINIPKRNLSPISTLSASFSINILHIFLTNSKNNFFPFRYYRKIHVDRRLLIPLSASVHMISYLQRTIIKNKWLTSFDPCLLASLDRCLRTWGTNTSTEEIPQRGWTSCLRKSGTRYLVLKWACLFMFFKL
jgi:hypothetical protein